MINFPLKTVYLDTVDSTNSYLKRIIKDKGLTEGTAVMARVQTSGRGRLGRSWLSVGGDTLCMSIAVKNEYTEGITLLAALALYEALRNFCSGKALQVKWPNDIICDNKKLCGILCERILEYTVIGIGVNVNDQSFADEIENKATSLYLLSGKKYETKKIFEAIISAFEDILTANSYSFTCTAKEQYVRLCANIGRKVRTDKLTGTAVGIGEDGSLIVEAEDGVHSVSSGEVVIHGIY